MTRVKRTTCADCKQKVMLTKRGFMREHYPPNETYICPGSGRHEIYGRVRS